jgi:hypothetical protein
VLIILQLLAPKPIDWKLSYLKKDNIPYGTSALNDALSSLFPDKTITTVSDPLYNALDKKELTSTNYIIINDEFKPDKLDSRELLRFVNDGNTAFIAAKQFSGKFADTLKLKTDDFFGMAIHANNESASINNVYKSFDITKINFVNPALKNKSNYVYVKGIENTYFKSFDTAKTTVLGRNSNDKTNFIKIHFGKGNIYVSSLPEVFSNYHFVHKDNCDYVYKALSYLPVQNIIWDEYYKFGNVKQDSPMRVILNNPPLMYAYYILLISLVLFMVIGIKRKQRIIPVVEPMRNTTLDFVDVVGTLYFQTGNHRNIADKNITYFLEYIRTAFYVKTTIYDDIFIERISNLSGIEKQKVHDLFYYFSDLSTRYNITQQELLRLNSMIENFKKESKR